MLGNFLLVLHCKNVSGEYRLKKYLTDGYNTEVRPVLRDKDIVNMTFEIALQQIVEVVSFI